MSIPEKIKLARTRLGETQAQFAKRFNTHANTVSRWESGVYQAPYEVIDFVLKVSEYDYAQMDAQGRLKVKLCDCRKCSSQTNIEYLIKKGYSIVVEA